MQLTKPQSVHIDIRCGSGRKTRRKGFTVYVDHDAPDAVERVEQLVKSAVEHGSTPSQEIEPSVAGSQRDSSPAIANDDKAHDRGQVDTRDAGCNQ